MTHVCMTRDDWDAAKPVELAVCVIAWRRPGMAADAVAHVDRSIEHCGVRVSRRMILVDTGGIAVDAPGWEVFLRRGRRPAGTGRQWRDAVAWGLETADYVLVVEEDCMIARDGLYVAARLPVVYPQAVSWTLYTRQLRPVDREHRWCLDVRSWWHPWATIVGREWYDRYGEAVARRRLGPGKVVLSSVLAEGLLEAAPFAGRCQNIGGKEYTRGGWNRQRSEHWTPWWVDADDDAKRHG